MIVHKLIRVLHIVSSDALLITHFNVSMAKGPVIKLMFIGRSRSNHNAFYLYRAISATLCNNPL